MSMNSNVSKCTEENEERLYERHKQEFISRTEERRMGKSIHVILEIKDLSWVISLDQQLLNEFNKVLFSEPLAS